MLPARPTALRLDGAWSFVPDPDRALTPERVPAGSPITVPGAWEAQLAQPQGIVRGWYRRRFRVPDSASARRLVIRFDAALRTTRAWLDGRLLGEHDDGFLPFELEAGEARPGAEHELVVAVENPFNALTDFPAFDEQSWRRIDARIGGPPLAELPAGKQTWYGSTSGLLGAVSVSVVPDLRLAGLTIQPDADAGRVRVRWRVTGAAEPGAATTVLTVRDPDGAVAASRSIDATAGEAIVAVPAPRRWDVWAPALYELHARLTGDGGEDETTARFGFRTVEVRDGSVLLNGRALYLRGALDQDWWPDGRSSPPDRDALVSQAARAREMGFNLLRCHVKVPSADYLDVADEAGLMTWCELPSWNRFSPAAARRARGLLEAMVDALGQHPSCVAWTIVNEEWGTDLQHARRDRRWLAATASWLRKRDPTRLVIDNSACETPHGPNFHLRSDLADVHAYRSMPDGAARWRVLVDEVAARPAWLWSPFGDAAPTGGEPLVLSELGGWGLPRPPGEDVEPWWWTTGHDVRRPAGLEARFQAQRLDRIWPDLDALADATQWQQFEGLAAQLRELRRHSTIRGYVITELADTAWEANGLLDARRGRKAFHDRLAEVNAEDVLLVQLPRADLWAAEALECDVLLASHPDRGHEAGAGAGPGRLEWRLELDGGRAVTGRAEIAAWPDDDVTRVGSVRLTVPDAEAPTPGELLVTATRHDGRLAIQRTRVVVVPTGARRSPAPRRVTVVEPLEAWSPARRVGDLGHVLVGPDDTELIVTARLEDAILNAAGRGAGVLVLARSEDAIPAAAALAHPARVVVRRPGGDVDPADAPWDGDWTSVFTWALPGVVPGLPAGGLLHGAHAQVYPDHVIAGLDVADDASTVTVGMFAGWVHRPAAVLASFAHGSGRITLTTLRLSPEDGPVASALLESIVQSAAGRAGLPAVAGRRQRVHAEP